MSDPKLSQKVPLREEIGYSLGDSSANFVFQIMMVFQLGFYTDVFGIKASAAGQKTSIKQDFRDIIKNGPWKSIHNVFPGCHRTVQLHHYKAF